MRFSVALLTRMPYYSCFHLLITFISFDTYHMQHKSYSVLDKTRLFAVSSEIGYRMNLFLSSFSSNACSLPMLNFSYFLKMKENENSILLRLFVICIPLSSLCFCIILSSFLRVFGGRIIIEVVPT